MNADVRRQLRRYFNLRNTRSKELVKYIPNYRTQTGPQIYTQLLAIYQQQRQYTASFSALIFTSLNTKGGFNSVPLSIPNKTVKSLDDYLQYVYALLLEELYQSDYTIYRIQINGIVYFIRKQLEGNAYIDLKDTSTAVALITPYITLTQLSNRTPTVTPILNRGAPKLQFCSNTPTSYNKLCGVVELLEITGGKKRNAKNILELLEYFVKVCSRCALYKTDANGDFMYNFLMTPIPVEVTVDNLKRNGITTEMLMVVCTELNVKLNIFTYSVNGVKRETNRSQISYQGGKTLNIIAENNHTYLLTDLNQIRRFNGIVQNVASGPNRKGGGKSKPPPILNTEHLSPEDFILKQEFLPTSVRLSNGVLNSFIVGKNTYIVNLDEEAREHYGADFIGQTAPEVASHYIQVVPRSVMTERVYTALTNANIKHRTHTDVVHPEYFTDGLPNQDGIQKYDINKAYTYSMRALKSIYTLDITQSITVCNKLDGEGLYFVKTTEQMLLHGTNWYSYDILIKAFQIGEHFVVEYKLNVVECKNPFPTILDQIDADISTPSFRKNVKNVLSGLCGITKANKTFCNVTTSQNVVMKFMEGNPDPFIKTLGTLFLYGKNTRQPHYTNRLITYIQILDQFNLLCYERATGTGGLLLARHIDAFYVLNPTNTDHLSVIEGDYKYEDYKILTCSTKERNVIYTGHVHTTTQWNTLTLDAVKNGLMVTGIAGTGKTYAIKQLMAGQKVQFIAPTNKAALLLEGVTIHNFLRLSINNEATYPKVDLDYVVLDEASMVTSDLWLHLHEFKRVNPTIRYVILGDMHQLPSIEDANYSFETTESILVLVNFNTLNLTKNYRQDEEGLKMCRSILAGTPYTIPLSTHTPHTEDIHLCYTNKTRQYLNHTFNGSTSQSIYIKLHDFQVYYDEEGEERKKDIYGYLHAGVKIICVLRFQTIQNSQVGRIVSANKERIVVKMEDGNQVDVSPSQFTHHFTLGYALTIHKAQGQTYDNVVNIYDVDKLLKKSYKYIYTAVSRATQFKNIHFHYGNDFNRS